MHTGFARIVVRWPNWLGDALMARPFLRGVRAAFPEARIAAIAPAPFLALLASDRCADEHWAFTRDGAHALGAQVRAFGADAAFVLPPSFSSAWQLARSGIATRVGFAGEWRDAMLTHAVRRSARGDLHLSREYLLLGAPFGVQPPAFAPLAPEAADAALAAQLAGATVLAPGAAYGPAKRWPLERWVALGRELHVRGAAVVVCGAKGDAEVAAAVTAGIGGAVRNLTGATALEPLAGALRGARAVISNDSGFAHLAAAVGAPTLAIFGSTSSAWTAPLGPARVLQHPPVCAPCFQRTCAIGYTCLAAVSVREVLTAWEATAAVAAFEGSGR